MATSDLFDTRLAGLAGVCSRNEFVDLLRANPPAHLHRAVAEAMTVTETSFFRDPGLFEALRTQVLPALLRLRASTRRLRIWSAASSTGQEGFSLAMLVVDLSVELAAWDVKIVGSDISRQAIEYAQRGRFRPNEVHRGLDPELIARHLIAEVDEWAIAPRIAELCQFRIANLCEPLPALPRFDLILLRNVLLYLSPEDRAAVFARMHRQIAPDGYLILGDSEQAEDSTDLFQPEVVGETYLYRPVNAI